MALLTATRSGRVGDGSHKLQVPSAGLRAGSSTAPLAMRLRETPLRMTRLQSIE